MSPQTPKPEAKKPVEYALILGLRRHREGAFAGLWELTELDKSGSVKRVVMDASTRSSVAALAAREVARVK